MIGVGPSAATLYSIYSLDLAAQDTVRSRQLELFHDIVRLCRSRASKLPISQNPMDTLLNYLRHKNPALNNQRCRPGKNTTCAKTSWKQPRIIEPWKDFDYDSLKAIYGGALNGILQRQSGPHIHPKILKFPFCEIYDENSLESLLVMWSQAIISGALVTAQGELNSQGIDEHIFMVKGGQAAYPGRRSSFRPDWAGIRRSSCLSKKATNILPGDTKLSVKWTSCLIEPGPVELDFQATDWLRPLTQIYTYCCKSNARYGYIITDQELVVVRVRPGSQVGSRRAIDAQVSNKAPTASPADRAGNSGILEYKAIPWDNEDNELPNHPRGLTVNIALWWLHMLAAEDSEIEDMYSPLRAAARKTNVTDNVHNDASDRTPKMKPPCPHAMPLREAHPVTPPSSGRSRKRVRDNDLDLDDRRRLKSKTKH